MAKVIMDRKSSHQVRKQGAISADLRSSTCARCGGLMVTDICMDLRSNTGELDCAVRRCVLCGDVVDPMILRHRGMQKESMTLRSTTLAEEHS